MTATVSADPREQIAEALQYHREAQHWSDCRCFMYRDPRTGQGFCSDREALWNRALAKLIDDCRAAFLPPEEN